MKETRGDAVARARELLAKATPGPWEERRHHFMDGEWMESSVVPVEDGDFREGDGDCVRINSCTADAELIAAAPTLLAELADEVERLQAKVAAFADIEEAHNASYRMLRDQSGMTELVAVQFSLTHLVDVGYDSWKETDHCSRKSS